MMVSQGGTGSGVVRARRSRELYKTLFGVAGQKVDLAKAAPPGGHPTTVLPVVRPDGTVRARRRAAGRPPTGCPTCPAPSCRRTGATRAAADGRRLPTHAVHRPAGAARRPSAAPRLGAAADRLDAAARRCSRCARSARRWCGRRPGRPRSTRGGDPTAFLKKHILNVAIGLGLRRRSRSVFDYRMLRAYAPVLYVALDRRAGRGAVAARVDDQRLALVDRAAGRLLDPAVGVREGGAGRRHGDAARRRSATPRTPRATSTSLLALAFAAVPMALVMLQPDLGTALVVAAIVLGVVAVSGAPAALGGRAGRRRRRWSRSSPCRPGCSRTTSSTGSAPSTTRRPTRKGVGYNVRQARIAIGSGGVDGQGLFQGAQTQGKFVPDAADRLHLHRRGGGARLRRRRRCWCCCSAWCCGGRPDRPAAPRTCSAGWWPPGSSAGSRSRPSRTSG